MTSDPQKHALLTLLTVNGNGWRRDIFFGIDDEYICEECKNICKRAVCLDCQFGLESNNSSADPNAHEHNDEDIKLYCEECLNRVLVASENRCPISQHTKPRYISSRLGRRHIRTKTHVLCPVFIQASRAKVSLLMNRGESGSGGESDVDEHGNASAAHTPSTSTTTASSANMAYGGYGGGNNAGGFVGAQAVLPSSSMYCPCLFDGNFNALMEEHLYACLQRNQNSNAFQTFSLALKLATMRAENLKLKQEIQQLRQEERIACHLQLSDRDSASGTGTDSRSSFSTSLISMESMEGLLGRHNSLPKTKNTNTITNKTLNNNNHHNTAAKRAAILENQQQQQQLQLQQQQSHPHSRSHRNNNNNTIAREEKDDLLLGLGLSGAKSQSSSTLSPHYRKKKSSTKNAKKAKQTHSMSMTSMYNNNHNGTPNMEHNQIQMLEAMQPRSVKHKSKAKRKTSGGGHTNHHNNNNNNNADPNSFFCTSPTIVANKYINITEIAQYLVMILNDPTQKLETKKLLVETIVNINHAQRTQLEKVFKRLHPKHKDFRKCLESVFKKGGKIIMFLFALLQGIPQFFASCVVQAVKYNKNTDLLLEIICQCSNAEIERLKYHYLQITQHNLITDVIEKLFGINHSENANLNKKSIKHKKNEMPKSMIISMLNGKRSENRSIDKKQMRTHLQYLRKKRKSFNRKDKVYLSTLLIESSFTHLRTLMHEYNESSSPTSTPENSFEFICAHCFPKTSVAGKMVHIITRLATNPGLYFAAILRKVFVAEADTDEITLMRVFVGRCEKDLGEIIRVFNENKKLNAGKTLKQSICEGIKKGTFRSILLRISGMYAAAESNRTRTLGAIPHIESSDTDNDRKIVTHMNANMNANANHSVPVQKSKSTKTVKFVEEHTHHHNHNHRSHSKREKHRKEKSSAVNSAAAAVALQNNIHNIDFVEFGSFMKGGMNERSVARLWKHLKVTDMSSIVNKSEVLSILLFSCVLYCVWKAAQSKTKTSNIDRQKLKSGLAPICAWILSEKMDSMIVFRNQFHKFGEWVIDYANAKAGQGNK